jgi:hypothetical protein
MAQRVPPILVVVLLAFAAGPGCGPSPPPHVPVSGTVTVDGKPLGEGYMYFKTIELGTLDRLEVNGGKFDGKVQVGKRLVEVFADRMKRTVIDGKEIDVPENYIDPAYNTETKLTADVMAAGPNQFSFDVKKK